MHAPSRCAVVERAGVADRFEIDSCGTGGGSSNWYLPGGFRCAPAASGVAMWLWARVRRVDPPRFAMAQLSNRRLLF